MKRIFTFITQYFYKFGVSAIEAKALAGISMAVIGLIAVCLIVVLIVAGFRSCGKSNPTIDEKTIQAINSKNEQEQHAALEKTFNEVDTTRKISDEKREAIVKKIEKDTKFGKNITADDLHKLLEDEENK